MTTENQPSSETASKPADPAATAPTSEPKTPASGSPAIDPPKAEGTDLGADDPAKKPEGEATPEVKKDGEPEKKPEGSATDLGEEEKAEEKPVPGAAYQGFPEDGQITITAPDGFEIDEPLFEAFKPVAKDLNLNAAGIQKLVDLKAQDTKNTLQKWGDHLKELKVKAQADPVIGGAKYPTAVAISKAAITKFAGPRAPAFRKMLNDYGVGAHPEMIHFLNAVGAATGETPNLPGGDGGEGAKKPLHEILFK